MATAQQLLDIARSQIGITENPPGSNVQPYGPAEPWCVLFIDWTCQQAGVQLPVTTASVYVLMDAFKAASRFYTANPQPGDIVFWNYGDGHAEFVEQVPMTGRSLVDIGGNTSSADGSPDNGGEVARKTRPWNSLCLGFGRPVYNSTKEQAMTLVIDPVGAVSRLSSDVDGWAFGARGHVYAYGQAPYLGGWDDPTRNDPTHSCVALVPTISGNGYFLVSNKGEVFAYGDAVWTGNYNATWGDGIIIGAVANARQPTGGVSLIRDDGVHLNLYGLPA